MRKLLITTLILATPLIAEAQGLDAVLAMLKTDNAWTVEQQKSICEIPAPPYRQYAGALVFRHLARILTQHPYS